MCLSPYEKTSSTLGLAASLNLPRTAWLWWKEPSVHSEVLGQDELPGPHLLAA